MWYLLVLMWYLLALTQRLLADRETLEVDCEENEKKEARSSLNRNLDLPLIVAKSGRFLCARLQPQALRIQYSQGIFIYFLI